MLQPLIYDMDVETTGENDAGVVINGGENVMKEVNHGGALDEVNHGGAMEEVNNGGDMEEVNNGGAMEEVNNGGAMEKAGVNSGENAMEKAGINNGGVIDVGKNYETTEATAENQNDGGESLFQMVTDLKAISIINRIGLKYYINSSNYSFHENIKFKDYGSCSR
ncbi:hypothetical protein TNIN_183971 [Trichonephila inaurata madagascariensis]|uniref:Uncharacterized protein n=1 Tax=Trichonephila inaurata madagascariensis TaxID=2747483 RepID=A0A8X6Y6W6_9ARAC|nr:hypothetical protein TNIN_183971 [Trichonephila inaurata madagascariensis]